MSILREIAIRLGLSTDEQSFAKGVAAGEGVAKIIESITSAAHHMAEQFVENIKGTAEYAERIKALSTATGIGTTSLQQLQRAAAEEGIGFDAFSASIVHLTRTMLQLKEAGYSANNPLQHMGIRATEAGGKLRSVEKVILDVADKFKKMEDSGEKAALVMQLFGRGAGPEMAEFLSQGREEIERYFKAQVMTPEQIAAGHELVRTQHALTEQTHALWRSAVGPLLPELAKLLRQFYEWKLANNELLRSRLQQWIERGIQLIRIAAVAFERAVKIIDGMSDAVGELTENWRVFLVAFAPMIAIVIAGFIEARIEAWRTAEATAAAGGFALAPWLVLAGIVGSLILLAKEWEVYQNNIGKKGADTATIFGRLDAALKHYDDMGKEAPAWLLWLKVGAEAVGKMVEGLKEMHNLLNTEQGWKDFERHRREQARSELGIRYETEGLSPEAKSRVARMLAREQGGNSQTYDPAYEHGEWDTRKRHPTGDVNPDWQRPAGPNVTRLTPEMPLPSYLAPMQGPMILRAPANITVEVHPSQGMDEKAIGEAAAQKAQELWQQGVDDAGAAAGYTP